MGSIMSLSKRRSESSCGVDNNNGEGGERGGGVGEGETNRGLRIPDDEGEVMLVNGQERIKGRTYDNGRVKKKT